MDIFRLRQNDSRTGLLTRSMKNFGNMEKVWRGRNMNIGKAQKIQKQEVNFGQRIENIILNII